MPSLAATRRGHVRAAVDRGAGGHDDQVDVGGGEAGVGQRLLGGGGGHVGDRLGVGDPPLGDADPVADPLVVGVDDLGEVVVGEHPGRLVVAERDDRDCRSSVLSSDAGEGLARGDRVVVVGEPLDEHARRRARSPRPVPCRVTTWPMHLAGLDRGALGEVRQRARRCRRRWRPRPGTRIVGSWLGAMPCRAIRSRAAARSSGVFSGDDLGPPSPLSSRLTRPARVPAGGSSMTPVTPRSARVRMHRSQRTGAVTWRTRRRSIVAAVVDGRAVEVGQQDPGRVGRR